MTSSSVAPSIPEPGLPHRGLVILGVAASDAHAVANSLIAQSLRLSGFTVVNLGVCTPLAEFADAFARHPDALAVVIGSINGHAYDDLCLLPALRAEELLGCPVVVGGNLSIGSRKDADTTRRLRSLGVDHLPAGVPELHELLDSLARAHTTGSRQQGAADRLSVV